LPKVVRVTKARCAIKVVGMRRRKRAARISLPSLVSALFTGNGSGGAVLMFYLNAHYLSHKYVLCPLK
jgi:hypothetical protein